MRAVDVTATHVINHVRNHPLLRKCSPHLGLYMFSAIKKDGLVPSWKNPGNLFWFALQESRQGGWCLSFPSCPTGTENVVRACCALSIPYLLYTSSIAAVGPNTSCEPLLRWASANLLHCSVCPVKQQCNCSQMEIWATKEKICVPLAVCSSSLSWKSFLAALPI